MQQSQVPAKFPIPFANGAGPSYIRDIPEGSQIGIVNGAASLQDGFPPLCFLPVDSGGVPPFGQDINGILKLLTLWARWQAAGGLNLWDGTFASKIGGYPRGALLSSTTAGLAWLNMVDGNLTNPDGGTAAGWLSVMTGAAVPQTSLVHAGADTSSTPNVITIPALSPPISALANYQVFEIVPAADITGPTTVSIQSFGAIPLKRNDGADPSSGDGPAGRPFLAVFLNGVLRRLGQSSSEVSSTVITNIFGSRLVVGGRTAVYNSPGTYTLTLPADVSTFAVETWGGGGGGGGATGNGTTAAAAGGGGGDYEAGSYACRAGSALTIVVGGGGSGGSAAGSNGGNGALSSVTYIKPDGSSATIVAGGGTGGGGSTGGPAANGPGGTGSGGLVSRPGYIGGLPYNVGSTNTFIGGSGGSAYNSSTTPPNFGAAGNGGSFPAGGGAGSAGNNVTGNGSIGGPGASGLVIARY
ncbi:glycine-rich domain-containing protein [Methylobacterium sp. Gmos1]